MRVKNWTPRLNRKKRHIDALGTAAEDEARFPQEAKPAKKAA